MKKLFSILIPLYNAENNIGTLVSSLISQSEGDTEIIVLNDGSTDGGLEICRKLEAENPDIVRVISRENRGVVRTRRELLEASTGEWIWIPDSDDGVADNALELLRGAIKRHPETDMILFDYVEFNIGKCEKKHQLNAASESPVKKETLYEGLVTGTSFNMLWSKIFRRSCVDFGEDYSRFENVRLADDKLQMLPIATRAENIIYLRESLYYYDHRNTGSLTHSFGKYTASSVLTVMEKVDEFIDIWGMRDSLEKRFLIYVFLTAYRQMRAYILCGAEWATDTESFYKFLTSDTLVGKCLAEVDTGDLPRSIRKECEMFRTGQLAKLERFVRANDKKANLHVKVSKLLLCFGKRGKAEK